MMTRKQEKSENLQMSIGFKRNPATSGFSDDLISIGESGTSGGGL